jgi:hypothetical protein
VKQQPCSASIVVFCGLALIACDRGAVREHTTVSKASTTILPGVIVSSSANKCVTFIGAFTYTPDNPPPDGTPIVISDCDGRAAEQWTFVERGTYTPDTEVRAFGKCLTLDNGVTSNGTAAELFSCEVPVDNPQNDADRLRNAIAASQLWTFSQSGAVTNQGTCLDLQNWGTANGTPLQAWSCDSRLNQRWQVIAPKMPITSLTHGCMTPVSDTLGSQVQVQPCTGASSTEWQVLPSGEIKSPSGLCLDVTGDGIGNGTPMQLWTCNGQDGQIWTLESTGEIQVFPDLRLKTDKCLEASGTAPGSILQLDDCSGGSLQVWGLGLAAPETPPPASSKIAPIAVTASSSVAGGIPRNAVDGDPNTMWNSGGRPTQWIQLDLGRPQAIGKLRLLPAQDPNGPVTLLIAVGNDPSKMREVTATVVNGQDGVWLELAGPWEGDNNATGFDAMGNVRYVRITIGSGPSWVAWREIEVYGAVQYFGYDDVGPRSVNMFEKIASTNVTDTATIQHEVQGLTDTFKWAMTSGQKVWLRPYDLFMASDYKDRIDKVLVPAIQAYPNAVAAIYIADEPFGNGGNPGGYPAEKASLTAIHDELKNYLPNTPIATVLQATAVDWLDKSYFANTMFDWVGFDCYDTWANCNMDSRNKVLRSNLSPDQRMIAVPWAQAPLPGAPSTLPASQNYIIQQNLDFWNAELVSHTRYVLVLPFLFTEDAYGQWILGARYLPLVRERLFQLENASLPTVAPQIFPSTILSSTDKSVGGSGVPIDFLAFDRDEESTWAPDVTPSASNPAWTRASFPGLTHITRVTIEPAESWDGTVQYHDLYAITPAGFTWLHSFATSADRQVLTWTGSADVTDIEVITYRGAPWQGWREISIFDDATP